MSEKVEKLVRMANQIADFFGPYPEAEAVAGIQEHIRAFWTPSMIEEFYKHVDAGGAGLRPRVMLAVEKTRAGKSPTHKAVAGPKELGEATSDAG